VPEAAPAFGCERLVVVAATGDVGEGRAEAFDSNRRHVDAEVPAWLVTSMVP
jgi:hypothetical protein